MNDIRIPTEGELEGGEVHSSEQQALDDATYQPRAFVEQSGDYHQAEAVQTTLASVVENASAAQDLAATPQPIPHPEGESILGRQPSIRGDLDQVTVTPKDKLAGDGIEATPITLPGDRIEATPITLPDAKDVVSADAEDIGATPQPIPHPEDKSVLGRQPSIRGDLDQVSIPPKDELAGDGIEATPITLPGDRIEATPITLPDAQDVISAGAKNVALDGSNKDEFLPLNGDVRVLRRFTWDSQATLISEPSQPIEFEKPILHKELTDLDKGLGGVDDLGSLIPGPGKIGNAPGEQEPGSDLFGGIPGLEGIGFDGGPSDLKNTQGSGMDMPPEGFHRGPGSLGQTMQGGGRNEFWGWNLNPDKEQAYQASKELTESDEVLAYDPLFWSIPKDQTMDPFDPITPATSMDYSEREAEMGAFVKAQKEMEDEKEKQKDAAEKRKGIQSDEEGVGKPLGSISDAQTRTLNPDSDQSQISTQSPDDIGKTDGGGMLKPEMNEKVEDTLDNKARLANTSPKMTTDQVTDPPEHQPGTMSEDVENKNQ